MSTEYMPKGPLGKEFLQSLRQEFPEEFSNKPLTAARQLKEMDSILAVEENYLDSLDSELEMLPDEGFSDVYDLARLLGEDDNDSPE